MVVEKVGQKVIKNLNVPNRKVAQKVNEIIESGGGGEITVDPSLNPTSTNPVENQQIQNKFTNVDNTINQHDSSIRNINSEIEHIDHDLEGHATQINLLQNDISDINGEIEDIDGRLDYHDTQIETINGNITDIEGQIENHGSAITQLQNETVRLDTEKEERFNVVSPLERSSGLMSVNVTDVVQQDNSLPVSSDQVNTSMLNLWNLINQDIETVEQDLQSTAQNLQNQINTKANDSQVIKKEQNNQQITVTDVTSCLSLNQRSVDQEVFPKLILCDVNHTQSDNRWLGCIEFRYGDNITIARLILQSKGSSKQTELLFEVKKQDGTWKDVILANNL